CPSSHVQLLYFRPHPSARRSASISSIRALDTVSSTGRLMRKPAMKSIRQTSSRATKSGRGTTSSLIPKSSKPSRSRASVLRDNLGENGGGDQNGKRRPVAAL